MASDTARDPMEGFLRRLGGKASTWAVAATALLTARVLYLVGEYGRFLILDDAFITFRYARNLAEGLGLVFNAGERVEGYTTFLWAVLLGASDALGLEILSMSMVLAYLASVGTIVLLVLLGRRLFGDGSRWVAVAPLLFAAWGAPARYVVSGMETSLFVFVVLLAIYLYQVGVAGWIVGVAFAVAAMTRPDAVVFLGAVGLYHLLLAPGQSFSQRVRTLLGIALGFAALYAPYFLWRYSYYGYLFPNTYYAKTGGGSTSVMWSRGWTHLLAMVRGSSLDVPMAFGLLGLVAARRHRFFVLPLLVTVITAAYIVSVGGDFMFFFGPRFLMPVLPLLFLLTAGGLAVLCRPLPMASLRAAVATVLMAFLLVTAFSYSWPARDPSLPFVVGINQSWTEVGRWLAANTPEDAVIALGAVGQIPYYSKRPTLDMLGLTDVHIAHREIELGKGMPGHEKSDSEYVLDRQPDYFVFVRLDPRGNPTSVNWQEHGERVDAEYRMIALAKWSSLPEPWVIETDRWTPQLGAKGYQAAIYQRRPEAAPEPATDEPAAEESETADEEGP